MKIARVFPTKTSMSPTDMDAYFDVPDMFTPKYDEVHISCTFTWDKEKTERLAYQWQMHGKVKIGGCAYNSPAENFVSGMYLKKGITITSRGCPNNCSFCFVPSREGKIRELPIVEGNIIQDNNILACSDNHIEKVIDMLKKQKAVEFKGGLESSRITPKIAEALRGLRIKTLWLACDTDQALKPLKKAVEILKRAGFKRDNLYCYVLVGKDINKEYSRLMEILMLGIHPFAQLLQSHFKYDYSAEWKSFARKWSRPAIYNSFLKTSRP